MALADPHGTIMAAILEGGDPLARWSEPWDVDRGNDLMQGGYPLKVTGEHWDRRNAHRLRTEAAIMGFETPTRLTVGEIAAHGARPDPRAAPVRIVTAVGETYVYNATGIRGLPRRLYRTFWEIHPVKPDARPPASSGLRPLSTSSSVTWW